MELYYIFNKCQFCDKYYPSSNGTMKCQAGNYDLKYDYACKDALDRMMAVLTGERYKKKEED